MNNKTYLGVITREIIENGLVVYHYETLFAERIYYRKIFDSSFDKYVLEFMSATISDFSKLPQEHKRELFDLNITNKRPSIQNILLHTDLVIKMQIEQLRQNGEPNLGLYLHFLQEFSESRKRRTY